MAYILVLEDERDIRALLYDAFEMEGFDVDCIGHPGQLSWALRDLQPDLFLIDLMLEGTSGIEVAQRLRAQGYDQVPMIAMTASALMAHMARASGLFDVTLHKPFDLDELCDTIKVCLRASERPAVMTREGTDSHPTRQSSRVARERID